MEVNTTYGFSWGSRGQGRGAPGLGSAGMWRMRIRISGVTCSRQGSYKKCTGSEAGTGMGSQVNLGRVGGSVKGSRDNSGEVLRGQTTAGLGASGQAATCLHVFRLQFPHSPRVQTGPVFRKGQTPGPRGLLTAHFRRSCPLRPVHCEAQ